MSAEVKGWRSFVSDCPYCGEEAEVFTTGRDNCAYDGDEARCSECHCPGQVVLSGDDSGTPDGCDETAYIDWHDEPGCSCEWCRTHPEPKEAA